MIAALRDRTTALLGQLTPRSLIIPPPFEALAERLSRQPVTPLWQIRLRRASLWAAGVMVAVGTGWVGRSILDPHNNLPQTAQEQPVSTGGGSELGMAVRPVADPALRDSSDAIVPEATRLPLPEERRTRLSSPGLPTYRVASVVSAPAVVPPPMLQLASALTPMPERAAEVIAVARGESKGPFGRLWKRMEWEEALEKAGGSGLPFIEGLPVIGVLFQDGEQGERPTSLVAQQDPSGEIILSIEGPTAKVNELLKSQAAPEIHASEWTRTPPDYLLGPPGSASRRVNRILTVTGRLSVDSLNTLARLATIR